MHRFVLYGLGPDDEILRAEQLCIEAAEAARDIARQRLSEFPKVELWQASVCLLRAVRPAAT